MQVRGLVLGIAATIILTNLALQSPVSAQEDPLSRSLAPTEFAKAIQQRKDPALRRDALEMLEDKLSGDPNPSDTIWALAALQRSLTAKFDREPFGALVFPRLKSNSPEIRVLALRCLPNLDFDLSDLNAITALADDDNPQVRAVVGGTLILIAKGDAPEEVIPALTRLLRDKDPNVVKGTVRSMWGQYSSPEFDELLIDLSHDDAYAGIAIYHGLSTMQTKSVAVCERLIEELENPDWNNSGRAAWGLTYGVDVEAHQVVEDALLSAIPEELNDYTRKNEYRALKSIATEKSRSLLEQVIVSEMETDEDKSRAREILGQLDRAKRPD